MEPLKVCVQQQEGLRPNTSDFRPQRTRPTLMRAPCRNCSATRKSNYLIILSALSLRFYHHTMFFLYCQPGPFAEKRIC